MRRGSIANKKRDEGGGMRDELRCATIIVNRNASSLIPQPSSLWKHVLRPGQGLLQGRDQHRAGLDAEVLVDPDPHSAAAEGLGDIDDGHAEGDLALVVLAD